MISGRSDQSSLRVFKQNIHILVENGEYATSLQLIHDFVERIITEPLCTAQVYGSKTLDDLCLLVGSANFNKVQATLHDAQVDQSQRPVFAYIVTKLQKSGGHTRVIEDFIKAKPQGRHVILSTELDGRSDVDYLMSGLAKQADILFEPAPKGSYQQRLTWLQKRLLKIHPQRVYLFNHHQDSVAVAAIQPDMGLDAWFYHHGDHHLCLGVYLPHLLHVDPHPMGYRNCRDVLGIENVYIPLAVDDKGCRSVDQPFMPGGHLTTCTAARSNKIESNYFISYLEVIPELLSVTGGKHIHIGRLTPWALFRLRRSLQRKNVPPDRFVYIPWVPSVWRSLLEHNVDLYIASFPVGGALTLIEAMGAGVPTVLHRHISSRFISCIDLAYPEALCWRHAQELIDLCKTMTPEILAVQSRLARNQYEKSHRREIFVSAFKNPGSMAAPQNRPETFDPEADEYACLVERHISLPHIISRLAYRLFKRIRKYCG